MSRWTGAFKNSRDRNCRGYGFGLFIGRFDDLRMIYHPGANPGFITYNATFPNDGLEIVILGNNDNFQPFLLFQRIFEIVERPTPAQIADQARPTPNENAKVRALAQQWLIRLQTGNIDRSQLTAEAAKELTPASARAPGCHLSARAQKAGSVSPDGQSRSASTEQTSRLRPAHGFASAGRSGL
ncbi:MAG: hypothetical protein WB681_05140 [Candidatus Cybelea sp.]